MYKKAQERNPEGSDFCAVNSCPTVGCPVKLRVDPDCPHRLRDISDDEQLTCGLMLRDAEVEFCEMKRFVPDDEHLTCGLKLR